MHAYAVFAGAEQSLATAPVIAVIIILSTLGLLIGEHVWHKRAHDNDEKLRQQWRDRE